MGIKQGKATAIAGDVHSISDLRQALRQACRRYTDVLSRLNAAAPLATAEVNDIRQTLKVVGRALRGRGLSREEHRLRLHRIQSWLSKMTEELVLAQPISDLRVTRAPVCVAPLPKPKEVSVDNPDSAAFWEKGQGKKLKRDLVVSMLLPVGGSMTEKHEELLRLEELGAVPPGSLVDRTTLWRWLKKVKTRGTWADNFDPASLVEELNRDQEEDPQRLAQARLLVNGRRFAGIVSYAAQAGLLSVAELRTHGKLLKQVPEQLFRDIGSIRRLTDKMEEAYSATLRQAYAHQAAPGREFLKALPPPALHQSPSTAMGDSAVTETSVSDGDDLYLTSAAFGSKAAALPKPGHLALVPSEAPEYATLQARARAMIVKPVIDGHLTPKAAAEQWRQVIRDCFSTSGMDRIHGIPREVFRRWLKLTPRVIRGWRAEVRAAQEKAIARGDVVPPLEQILRSKHHRTRKRGGGAVRTPELEQAVRERFLQPSAPKATTVVRLLERDLGISVSARTVQRICQEIDERERAKHRGGPAGVSLILDKRYLRQAQVPNGVWTIDNSWISKELIDPDVVIPSPDDFHCEAAIEELFDHGYVRRRRVDQLYMTVVMDVCTGLHLACRLWDRPVNTRTTLLALFDAVLKYGLPDVLYSDNGSEFKNKRIAEVLNRAEILQRFSRPYYPEARGRIERTFRTIKEQVLPLVPGYRGHGYEIEQEELSTLVTLKELEYHIQRQVELYINQARRRGMPVTRREHYENKVGARQLRRPGGTPIELALPLLFRGEDVLVGEEGLRANGKLYSAAELDLLPTGSKVMLYTDPYRDTGYCAVLDAKGRERSAFPVEAYGPGNPPPPIGVQKENAAKARRELQELAEGTRKKAAELKILQKAKAEGEAIAAELAEAVEVEDPDWEIVPSDGDRQDEMKDSESVSKVESSEASDAQRPAKQATALVPREGPTPRASRARRRIKDDEVNYNPLG